MTGCYDFVDVYVDDCIDVDGDVHSDDDVMVMLFVAVVMFIVAMLCFW
jgi:hypothetical protein